MDALSSKSAWSADRVESFLSTYRAPLRVAVQTDSGFPLLCSLWFLYEEGQLFCATQRDAAIVRHLESQPRCAFELAPNEPPYFGVRGRGDVTISKAGAGSMLERLIDRFLGPEDAALRAWLMGRADQEVSLAIEPRWLTSWDYSGRMRA